MDIMNITKYGRRRMERYFNAKETDNCML